MTLEIDVQRIADLSDANERLAFRAGAAEQEAKMLRAEVERLRKELQRIADVSGYGEDIYADAERMEEIAVAALTDHIR